MKLPPLPPPPNRNSLKPPLQRNTQEKTALIIKTTALFIIPLVGVLAGFRLIQTNQDLRQQASLDVYSIPTPSIEPTSTPVPTPSPAVTADPNELTTLDAYSFAALAVVGNSDTFVVTPDELGYGSAGIEPDEDVIFDYPADDPHDRVWARGYEWRDPTSRDEYHSTISGYSSPTAAETAFVNGPSSRTQGVTILNTTNITLPGIDQDSIHLFQASDPDHTINFSFQVGNYMVVLKAKNMEDLEFAAQQLETMAELLITDLSNTP